MLVVASILTGDREARFAEGAGPDGAGRGILTDDVTAIAS